MFWLHLAENPKAITEIYSVPPLLDNIQVVELKLHQDGPRMELRADLNQFPENPPVKWKRNRFNAVQINLNFFAVEAVEILEWSHHNILELIFINEKNGTILVEAYNQTRRLLTLRCLSFRISNISGYLDSSLAQHEKTEQQESLFQFAPTTIPHSSLQKPSLENGLEVK